MISWKIRHLLFSVLLLLCAAPAFAQVTEATLKINVMDALSSPVAGTYADILNEETNEKRIGATDSKDKTFFFGSYEGTRNAAGRVSGFQVETPQLRGYVARAAPNSIANQLLTKYAAPAPQQVAACTAASNNCLSIGNGQFIPINGTLFTTIKERGRSRS
jgi:hypothetical protein